jgi:hypothetical protein
MEPSLSTIRESSGELDTGLLMWLRLVNHCDNLLYRFYRPYRRRRMFKRIGSR